MDDRACERLSAGVGQLRDERRVTDAGRLTGCTRREARADRLYRRAGMIRPATPADVPALLGLVRELAEYERAPEEAVATEAAAARRPVRPAPAVFCDVAEEDGAVVGMAIWFLSFSTWLGRHGIYLEDLYVTPGPPRARATARRCWPRWPGGASSGATGGSSGRCSDWNRPAIDFYLALGADRHG